MFGKALSITARRSSVPVAFRHSSNASPSPILGSLGLKSFYYVSTINKPKAATHIGTLTKRTIQISREGVVTVTQPQEIHSILAEL